MKKFFDFVVIYGIKLGIYGLIDIFFVGMVVVLYFDFVIYNFGIQEYMLYNVQMFEVFWILFMFDQGFLYLSEQLGFGVEFDEDVVVVYEYIKVYFLVNWLLDGMIYDW